MKKFFTLLTAVLAGSLVASATVHTVSNSPTLPAQFDNMTDAIAAASDGDTIYISGSVTSYGDVWLDKSVTLIGAGYGHAGSKTHISTLYLYTGPSNSKIIGIDISYLSNWYSETLNVLIERCKIYSINDYGGFDGMIIKHSVIGHVHMSSSSTNILITNNLITGYISGSNSPSVLISNNVFIGEYTSWALSSISYAVISNNIFWNAAPSIDGYSVENCAFNNNITYQTSDDVIPSGSNVGVGNLIGVDPLFVNVPDATADPSYNYHLQAGSPGKNAGTDGTDIGLYGGGSPLNVPLDGRARIPLITQFDLLNSSISEGGSINVQVKARKND
jgi:hypothetical protein